MQHRPHACGEVDAQALARPGPASLLPGFMCLTGIPKGLQLEHGGCSVGTSPILMPTANLKSFKWQACRAIPTRHQHVTCTTRSLP